MLLESLHRREREREREAERGGDGKLAQLEVSVEEGSRAGETLERYRPANGNSLLAIKRNTSM